ncbi:MAG: hypothetical protein IPN03_07635 [Holophagales bacterium]|nr:hypothetical protein [Holophagales bacterium]
MPPDRPRGSASSGPSRPKEATRDRDGLEKLEAALLPVTPARFSRYQRLLQLLRSPAELAWTGTDTKDRLVVFTERIETLKLLREQLQRDFGAPATSRSPSSTGRTAPTSTSSASSRTSAAKSPVRLLSRPTWPPGASTSFLCRKMVHFDTPWSFIVFQQRNGRIDRYGQDRQPLIAYLFVGIEDGPSKGDTRILELLAEKDDAAQKNLGDPTALYGVNEELEEERITARRWSRA